MALFAGLRARASKHVPSPTLDGAVSEMFEAYGEALVDGTPTEAACEEAGRVLAGEGIALTESLDGLRETAVIVTGADPAFEDIRTLTVAWTETTLGELQRVSCEDPLTGLSSRAHARARLAEVLRESADTGTRYVLIVLDARRSEKSFGLCSTREIDRSLRLAPLAGATRTVFPGRELVARIGPSRIVVLVARDDRLDRRIALLRSMLPSVGDGQVRLWVEGLPDNEAGAAALLDDLARD